LGRTKRVKMDKEKDIFLNRLDTKSAYRLDKRSNNLEQIC